MHIGVEHPRPSVREQLSVIGLFAGIGGIEIGLHKAGHQTDLLCEIDPAAQRVLRTHFPEIPLISDVRELESIADGGICAAGFPCQDLSQAGRTEGIQGTNSGLVAEVFRLVERADPRWLLLENVPFMLQLDRGAAMRFLTRSLERLGFNWAYRVVDTRAFGLPQRRQRVIVLASRSDDPREILFVGDEAEPMWPDPSDVACGFYWTEGVRGLGWAVDAVPTLKGGSTIGIPSPPAIRFPDGLIATPDLRDAERLQGFDLDWTAPASNSGQRRGSGSRWKLVGNAVSVPVARWVGERLRDPRPYDSSNDELAHHQSGESERTGAISRCGDEMMRVMLYEAAQIMLVRSTKWSWLKAWAMKIARRRGMKKAIVALARRLAVIMHRIWVDGTEFRWTREAAVA